MSRRISRSLSRRVGSEGICPLCVERLFESRDRIKKYQRKILHSNMIRSRTFAPQPIVATAYDTFGASNSVIHKRRRPCAARSHRRSADRCEAISCDTSCRGGVDRLCGNGSGRARDGARGRMQRHPSARLRRVTVRYPRTPAANGPIGPSTSPGDCTRTGAQFLRREPSDCDALRASPRRIRLPSGMRANGGITRVGDLIADTRVVDRRE